MKTFKGRGEHSVSQLEEIIELQEEQLYQKQLINQDLLEALQEAIIGYDWIKENHPEAWDKSDDEHYDKCKKAISKALD